MWIALALAAATVAVYWPVHRHGFIGYDDSAYVRDNPVVARGLTLAGVAWAFGTLFISNWHPLTWLSHMLDCELFGVANPGAHHVVNVMWHVANSILLLLLLERATGAVWRSALVAALFALHPLHVESVAWLAERKDLLSTFFGLLAIWFYVDFARNGSKSRYALVLGCFALSLISKPMLVTLPCVLLLLDFWPLGRARIPRLEVGLVVEKLPLLALSAASSGVAYVAQKLGGSMQGIEALPLSARMGNAVVSYADYLWTMVWPVDLAVLYPFSQQLLGWRLAASALFLAGISSLVLRRAQERPYLLVGWLWYLGTLVPVIGLVQVGLQAKADRYTYVPLIGIFIMIAWSLPDPMRHRSPRASALAAGVLAVLVALAWRSHVQVGYWRDTVTLFDRTLAITRDNYMAHDVKGYALAVERGWLDEAIVEYREALRIHPRFPLAMNHLANALFEKRALAEAAEWYRKLLELAPHSLEGQQNLAVALSQMGRYAEAVPHYREALRLRPKLLEAQVGLGLALDLSGRMAEAIPVYEAVLEIDPNRAEVHMQLGKALAKQGRTDEGIAHLREALRLQPELADARASLERLQREPER